MQEPETRRDRHWAEGLEKLEIGMSNEKEKNSGVL